MTATNIQAVKVLDFLNVLTENLNALLTALLDEQRLLIHNESGKIIDIAKLKASLVENIETSFQEFQSYIEVQLGLADSKDSLVQWIKDSNLAESSRLFQLHSQLIQIGSEVEKTNIANGKLLNRQSNRNRFLMKLLSGIANDSETYDTAGKEDSGRSQSKIGIA